MIAAILASRPVRWLVGALAAVLAFFGIVMMARRDAAQDAIREAENDALNEYIETRRRVDGVATLAPDAARERLRARADKSGGNL